MSEWYNSYDSVWSCCHYLRFIIAVLNIHEVILLSQHCNFLIALEIPNYTASICRAASASVSFFVDSNGSNFAFAVLFLLEIEHLGLFTNSPNSYETITSSTYYLSAIACSINCRDLTFMRLTYHIIQLAWLWKKCSDVAITPSWYQWFSISHKCYR